MNQGQTKNDGGGTEKLLSLAPTASLSRFTSIHLLALTRRGPLQGHLSKKFVGKGVVSGLLKLYMVSVAQKVDSAIHLPILS